MRRSKFRTKKVDLFTENRYYEVCFYTMLEKTAESVRLDKLELLQKWCEFTGTDFNKLSRVTFKLGLATYPRLKYLRMKSLLYFGVTLKQIKEVFGITANYMRIPQTRTSIVANVTTEEEINEVKKLLDRLTYLLYLFRYTNFDENGIVLKTYKEYNKQRILELYIRNTLFYYNKRFKKLFPNSLEKPTWVLGKMLMFNTAEIDFVNSKIFQLNNINAGEIRSLLYYAFGISIEDTKELLQHTPQNINYIYKKYKDRQYMAVLNDDEFKVVERFLKVLYDNIKFICCMKGVPNGQ